MRKHLVALSRVWRPLWVLSVRRSLCNNLCQKSINVEGLNYRAHKDSVFESEMSAWHDGKTKHLDMQMQRESYSTETKVYVEMGLSVTFLKDCRFKLFLFKYVLCCFFFLPEHVKEVFATQASKLKCEVFFLNFGISKTLNFTQLLLLLKMCHLDSRCVENCHVRLQHHLFLFSGSRSQIVGQKQARWFSFTSVTQLLKYNLEKKSSELVRKDFSIYTNCWQKVGGRGVKLKEEDKGMVLRRDGFRGESSSGVTDRECVTLWTASTAEKISLLKYFITGPRSV